MNPSARTTGQSSPATAAKPGPEPAATSGRADCRVWERHGCEVQAACQAVANRSNTDLMWPATIRNISRGGVGLIVNRRFERGTGLFIECQSDKAEPVGPFMAKVVHAMAQTDGNWLLGCCFVRPLTAEELNEFLQAATHLAERQPKRPAEIDRVTARVLDEKLPAGFQKRDSRANLLAGVTLEAVTPEGETVRLMARRLCLMTGIWPPAEGALLQLSIPTNAGNSLVTQVRALGCSQQEGRWTMRYAFIEQPSDMLLRLFGHTEAAQE